MTLGGLFRDPGNGFFTPAVQLGYTASSLSIQFSTDTRTGNEFFYQTGGSAVFSYATSAPGVPEPASWAMMVLGFGIAGVALRRRTKATVRIAYA